MTESIFALIGTIFAGVGLKAFEWFVNRAAKKRAEQARITALADKVESTDRLQQIADLKAEIERLRIAQEAFEKEMLEWREKYWALREDAVGQLVKLTTALEKIRELTDDKNITPPTTIGQS